MVMQSDDRCRTEKRELERWQGIGEGGEREVLQEHLILVMLFDKFGSSTIEHD